MRNPTYILCAITIFILKLKPTLDRGDLCGTDGIYNTVQFGLGAITIIPNLVTHGVQLYIETHLIRTFRESKLPLMVTGW